MPQCLDYKEKLGNLLDKQKQFLEHYSGKFDLQTVRYYADKLNEFTKEYKTTQRKIFYVFVELAQNVGYYSDERMKNNEKTVGCGGLVIYEEKENIGFIIGNKIKKAPLEILKAKIDIINSLNREKLREYKREQRNLIPGTNGGAHIGMIMVALTTGKKLDVNILEGTNGDYFFTINVKVEKQI